jgi:hypothetical protein
MSGNGTKYYTYVLIDPTTDEVFYIGKGTRYRMTEHLLEYRGRHSNPYVKNKIRRIISLGLTPRAEKIFEHQDEWPCHWLEVQAIAFYGRVNLCNLTDGGEGASGAVRSEEARRKLSAAKSGEKHHFFGKHLSLESKLKISKASKGRRLSGEWLTKTLERITSEAFRQQMSQKKKGIMKSEETKAKISAANIGKKHSEATKAKLATYTGEKNSRFGVKLSEETKRKMSLAALARYAKTQDASS